MSQKKCYIFDYDGTLADSCQPLSVQMVAELVNLARNKKIIPVVMSGTDNAELLRFTEKVRRFMDNGAYFYLAGNCGADIIKVTKDFAFQIFKRKLTTFQKKEIYSALGEVIHKFDLDCDIGGQVIDRGSQITLSCIGRNASSEDKKNWDPDCSIRNEIRRHLDSILCLNYSINVAGTTSIDILADDWDKSYGVKQIADIEQLSLDQILFFGDKCQPGGNDYPATQIVDFHEVTDYKHTLQILEDLRDSQ